MTIKVLKTEKDYYEALQRMIEIFNASADTPEGDEAEILGILIEKYEKENYPIDDPDPVKAIEFRMEQLNMRKTDLAEVIGYKSRVSEILSRKRKLTLHMIRNLHNKLKIPYELLIAEY